MGANALRINGPRDPQCRDAAAAPPCAREEGLDLAAPCGSGEPWLSPGMRPHGVRGRRATTCAGADVLRAHGLPHEVVLVQPGAVFCHHH